MTNRNRLLHEWQKQHRLRRVQSPVQDYLPRLRAQHRRVTDAAGLLFLTSLEGIFSMIKLKNQIGSLIGPVHTLDAIDEARFGDAMFAEIRQIAGELLDDDQLARIKATVEKYSGGGVTNGAGVTRAGDAADAGRQAAAVVARNIAHNQSVARGYADFWDRKNQELRDSVRR
jgi:hypothetical protein